jgi:hypothetical protein
VNAMLLLQLLLSGQIIQSVGVPPPDRSLRG